MKTIKNLLKKLLLFFVNLLYSPYYLGYWSDNNTWGYCVTNFECTKYRWVGHNKWSEWTNNPGYLRPWNEYLERANFRHIDLKVLWFIFKNDSKIQSSLYFVSNFLKLEIASIFIWVASKLFNWVPVDFWYLTEATLLIACIFTVIDVYFKLLLKRQVTEE